MNKDRYLSLCKFCLINEIDNVDIIKEFNFVKPANNKTYPRIIP